jgi:formylglycine-generating enzyme required for sulfatase activity
MKKHWLSLLCLFGILFAFTAKVHADGTYLVVNLETGQYRYTDDEPNLDDDACRTTELWLRYIPAGTFTMGSPADELGRSDTEVQHKVTLTQPFYIGVFECTQRQWELVMGDRPSYFNNDTCNATRPVEQVSYDMIRGTGEQAGAGWPTYGHAVDATSFMGVLRDKTGLMFDLPTEAQWEYACRAGTETALNSNENLTSAEEDANMGKVGRYRYNAGGFMYTSPECGTSAGTAKVGSYNPNNWGLYDMHGNVWEWCLDWTIGKAYDSADATNPVGDATGLGRVVRGGCWNEYADNCRSALRYVYKPSSLIPLVGFRIVFLPPEAYAVTVVKGTADKTKAVAGETVAITANMPASGQTFDKWTGDVEFANETAVETTFKMPAKAVTVTATFKKVTTAVKTYKIVVVNGTADKAKAAAGETVKVTAKPAPTGKVFDRWTGGAVFADPKAMETTFTMPAKAVTPKAIYKKK